MIGCKSSLQPVLDILKENNVHSVSETQFCQGRTMRWAVAWTFTELSLKSTSWLPAKQKTAKPLIWTLRSEYSFKQCIKKMNEMFEKLQVSKFRYRSVSFCRIKNKLLICFLYFHRFISLWSNKIKNPQFGKSKLVRIRGPDCVGRNENNKGKLKLI